MNIVLNGFCGYVALAVIIFCIVYTICYAPDGICTNPFRDCINCPKRGTGGTWSTNTTIKAKGKMFQERFNDNNKD